VLRSKNLGLAIGIAANLIGGASYLVAKIALEDFSPATIIFLRMLIAIPLLFLFSGRGWLQKVTREDWGRMAFVAVFGLASPHLVGIYGLRDAASLNAAILIGMEPIAIVALSAIFLRERITLAQLIGIAIAFAGATLVVSGGKLDELTDVSGRANLLLALSGALWAIYTIGVKPTLERVPPTAVTAVTSLFSMLVLAPAALMERPDLDLASASAGPIAAVIVLGVGVSFAGTVLWNLSLRSLTATQMGALVFIQPIAGALLGALAGDPLTLAIATGSILVLAGVYFTEKRPMPAE
jgi:drug/metabolite transporter (DMT)-like permease